MRTYGLEALATLLAPSYVAFRGWVPAPFLAQARVYFERSDVLGIFICVVIVGSLVDLPRRVLLRGLVRIWVPLLVANLAAVLAGSALALLIGMPMRVALLQTLAPAMVGGLTAGALPLAIAYAGSTGVPSGIEMAYLLPAVVLGNLLAVVASGVMAPWAGGSGTWSAAAGDRTRLPAAAQLEASPPLTSRSVLRAIALLAALYLLARAASRWLGYPSTLVVLVIAAAMQLLLHLPQWLRAPTLAVYRWFVRFLTYPLLLAVGLLLLPWDVLLSGLRGSSLGVLLTAVVTLALIGAWSARWVRLAPAEGALLAVTRTAMGGTGDLAILTAARRLDLMPFAQIATRVFGALTLALALMALPLLH